MQTIAHPEAAGTIEFHDASWRDTVQRVSAMAQARLPEALHGRIQRATGLVLAQGVWLEDDGHTCQVRARDGQRWYSANGSCPCEDHQRAPEHLCKHRLARGIYLRASALLREGLTVDLDSETLSTAGPAAHDIPPHFITCLHGKPFVRYAGLLALAHERGLVSLRARLISVTADLALAEADATFADGTTYSECADSTPQNVPQHIRPHFPRMALTRAKARALRDALNIGMCGLEELAE